MEWGKYTKKLEKIVKDLNKAEMLLWKLLGTENDYEGRLLSGKLNLSVAISELQEELTNAKINLGE
jgi:hypothetical protein